MPLRTYIDPGGEVYVLFARQKLADMKAWMLGAGLRAFSKTYWINEVEKIFIEAKFLSDAVSVDTIRIAAGGATDYVAMAMPNPVPYRGVSVAWLDSPVVIVTSSGDVLGSQVTTDVDHVVTGQFVETLSLWTGQRDFRFIDYSFLGGTYVLLNDYFLSVTVPEDCVVPTTHLWKIKGGTPDVALGYLNDGAQVYATRRRNELDIDSLMPTQRYVALQYDPVPTAPNHGFFWGNYPAASFSLWTGSVTPRDASWVQIPFPTDALKAADTGQPDRRARWLKKNSDEFVAALKTGFAPGAPGVTRAELQTGRLPGAWEFQIKRDADVKYDSYAPANTVGRKTRRAVQYAETAFLETVLSDTSAGLTQAGVKVTERAVTLTYSIPVTQPDGSVVNEQRERSVVGTLTQTVTRHDDADGNELGLSRQDVYSDWYNREATTLPTGVPSTITAAYLKDRTPSRMGVVLNGTVQTGYNADSLLGTIGNPLTYALYIPPFPKASSTVTADLIPDFIATWHRDAKITYDKTGATGSNALNDSALYGVTKIKLTPIGLIANGAGAGAAGESVGMFPTGENGVQVELYGTAIYNFDWQTGALTFSSWKPLKDADGNEIASRVVDLPAGTTWNNSPVNCLVTYQSLRWPDVVAALQVRDRGLPTATAAADKILYALIQAAKGI